MEGFWRTYTETTGWRIDPAANLSGSVTEQADAQPNEQSESQAGRSLSAADAGRLAEAARAMAEQLQEQQTAMRLQQTELAARASVILDISHARTGADAIDRLLADATLATGTDAAAVYLLDEDTERLATRFVFGLSPEKRLGTSRPLRGSRGDLEAMVQGVLVMENLQNNPIDTHWAPEAFASAICVSLGGTELPIGTLWLYSRVAGEYPDAAGAAARLAAENVCHTLAAMSHPGELSPLAAAVKPSPTVQLSVASATSTDRVDAELERMLANDFNEADFDLDDDGLNDSDFDANDFASEQDFDIARFVEAMEPLPSRRLTSRTPTLKTGNVATSAPPTHANWTNQIADWQHDTLPIGARLAPNWSVDGMVESPLSIAQSWHYWDVLPDGIISLAACQFGTRWDAAGNMTDTLDATIARAALQAHASYRHTPQDAITRILHTLLQVRDEAIDETGRANLALFYAHIDPDTGRVRMSSVGKWSSLIVSRYGYRPLNLRPTLDAGANEFPGEQTAMNQETTLLRGEALLVGGADWMGIAEDLSAADLPPTDRHESVQNRIGSTLKQAMVEGERSTLSALRRMMAGLPLRQERLAISLLHE